MPNVAWITSSGAKTSGFGVFNDFLLGYGWEQGFASESDAMTLLNLATYTKRQYDALFSGILFEGEDENKSVMICNEPLLAKVIFRPHGTQTSTIASPGRFTVSASVNQRSKIVVDWSPSEDAKEYYIFYRHVMTEYLSFIKKDSLDNHITSCDFSIDTGNDNSAQRELNNYLLSSNQETPMCFIVKAVNGAGVSKGGAIADC